jgi:hypothetical protein
MEVNMAGYLISFVADAALACMILGFCKSGKDN